MSLHCPCGGWQFLHNAVYCIHHDCLYGHLSFYFLHHAWHYSHKTACSLHFDGHHKYVCFCYSVWHYVQFSYIWFPSYLLLFAYVFRSQLFVNINMCLYIFLMLGVTIYTKVSIIFINVATIYKSFFVLMLIFIIDFYLFIILTLVDIIYKSVSIFPFIVVSIWMCFLFSLGVSPCFYC